MRKTTITSLTAAALATVVLAGANMTHTAKADMTTNTTTNTANTTDPVNTTNTANATNQTAVNNDVATNNNQDNVKVNSANLSATSNSNDDQAYIDNGTFAPANKKINTGDPTTYDKYGLKPEAARAVQNGGVNPASLSDYEKRELNKVDFSSDSLSSTLQITYRQLEQVANSMIKRDKKYAVPYFNPNKIINMPAAITKDAETGKKERLEIWDSWPVQDAKTGQIVNWNGYQLVIGMMGRPKKGDNHIYLLYNKYGDNNFSHWKVAGSIFGYNRTNLKQEWSGSATVNKDGSIQLFYTDVDRSDGTNNQRIATVTLNLKATKGKVQIASLANNHILFAGDGYYYQTYSQWLSTNKGADNFTMRDAHVVLGEDGHRYLVFEASTGKQNYQGLDQIYKWSNYGGNDAYNLKAFLDLVNNLDMKSRGTWANACIGIVRLSDDETYPIVDKILSPLVAANISSDEIERPNIVKIGDLYYLFTDTRLNRGSNDYAWNKADQTIGDNVGMLGYVSDTLTGEYVPLNGSGVVLTASVPFNWRTATYSYYALPVEGHPDLMLITSYMTNRAHAAGDKYEATWSPSFLIKINSDFTTQVLAKATNQGDWIWDKDSENKSMLVKTLKEAGLIKEKFTPKKATVKKIKLTKNAIVYDFRGKAERRGLKISLLKRGKSISVTKTVTIKGTKYYQIGKNQFVKVANTLAHKKSFSARAVVRGKKNSKVRVYTSTGRLTKRYVVASRTYRFTAKKRIHGKTYYKLAYKNQWILASKLRIKK